MEVFTELFTKILETANSVPPEIWSTIIEILISAIVVSPIALGIKKWFSIDGEKKMVVIVTIGSFAAATGAYLLTVPEFAPWMILVQGWLTLATTQPVYYFFIKPMFKRLGNWFTDQITKATQISEAKAAQVPPEGLPALALSGYDNFAD